MIEHASITLGSINGANTYIVTILSAVILQQGQRYSLVYVWDLLTVIIASLLLAVFIYLIPDNPGRVVLGLPFILFFPGYVLICSLFPEKASLDLIERIALSFGISIAVVPLIGFGLNYTPFGIRLAPILLSLIIFNIAFAIVATWRRLNAKEPFLPFNPRTTAVSAWEKYNKESGLDKALSVILVIAIISSVIALAYVVVVPKEGEHFSEFYLLGPGGKATGYPNNLSVGESAGVIVGIANHEYRDVNYSVEVWLSNMTFANNITTVNRLYYFGDFEQTLPHVDPNIEGNWEVQWQRVYNFTVPYTGQFKMWFVLLLDGEVYDGPLYTNVVGTEAATRFLNIINSDDSYTLNLNLNVGG